MNYIWEIVLNARKNGISEEDLFFKQAKEFSPYYEQSFSDIDISKVYEGGEIEINGLYRFDRIIARLFAPDLEEYEELRKYIFDLCIHFLCSIDLYSGLTKQDIYIMILRRSIEQGDYGESLRVTFNNLNRYIKYEILLELLNMIKLGSSLNILRRILKKVYKDIMIYQMRYEPDFILIYVGVKKSIYEEDQLKLILDLFLPMEYRIKVFWDKHFGMISIDETMVLDNIMLF